MISYLFFGGNDLLIVSQWQLIVFHTFVFPLCLSVRLSVLLAIDFTSMDHLFCLGYKKYTKTVY